MEGILGPHRKANLNKFVMRALWLEEMAWPKLNQRHLCTWDFFNCWTFYCFVFFFFLALACNTYCFIFVIYVSSTIMYREC